MSKRTEQKIMFLVLPMIKEIPFPEIKDPKKKKTIRCARKTNEGIRYSFSPHLSVNTFSACSMNHFTLLFLHRRPTTWATIPLTQRNVISSDDGKLARGCLPLVFCIFPSTGVATFCATNLNYLHIVNTISPFLRPSFL